MSRVWENFLDLIESTFTQAFVTALDAIPVMLAALVTFAIVGGLYIALAQRKTRSLSVGSVVSGLFPHRFYGAASYVDKRIAVFTQLVVGPVTSTFLILLSLAIGIDIGETLASTFGERTSVLQSTWAIATVQFVAYTLASSLGWYIAHRGMHRIPLLWSFHRSHHSAEVLTPLLHFRSHPGEYIWVGIVIGVLRSVVIGATLYFTGTQLVPETAPLLLVNSFLFYLLFAFLGHSHIPISFGRLNAFLGGPVMHQIHHSAEPRHRDKNFSNFPTLFWDWMFGSLYMPEPGEVYRWGLNDKEIGENNPHRRIKDFYFEPIRNFWRHLKAIGPSARPSTTAST